MVNTLIYLYPCQPSASPVTFGRSDKEEHVYFGGSRDVNLVSLPLPKDINELVQHEPSRLFYDAVNMFKH